MNDGYSLDLAKFQSIPWESLVIHMFYHCTTGKQLLSKKQKIRIFFVLNKLTPYLAKRCIAE